MDLEPVTCCFTGHRKIPPEYDQPLRQALENAVRKLITERNCTRFCIGGAHGFDQMAGEVIQSMRQEFPEKPFVLLLYLPYQGIEAHWSDEQKRAFRDSEKEYASPFYHRGCFYARNRAMVDCSEYCICYLTAPKGGTAFTVQYAEKKHLDIQNLNDELPGAPPSPFELQLHF